MVSVTIDYALWFYEQFMCCFMPVKVLVYIITTMCAAQSCTVMFNSRFSVGLALFARLSSLKRSVLSLVQKINVINKRHSFERWKTFERFRNLNETVGVYLTRLVDVS